MIELTQFIRKPNTGNYSVERLHKDIRLNLPDDINSKVRINRFYSKGILRRIIDSILALKHQRNVNHVTGDTHYISFFLKREKTVLTILDCVGLERSKGIKFWLLWFFWYWLPEKRCSLIVVISEATKKQVIRYINCDPKKIRVIHCNVSDEFLPMAYNFNEKKPRILHIGTGENKNLDRHIDAIQDIECSLIIIGKLSNRQQNILDSNKIDYENFEDLSNELLADQYRLCDLLLFASTYEGFGLPIVEAQAVGRPVITSNIWSMPEVAGSGALIVDPFNVQNINNAIKRIINQTELRDSLINLGFENVKRFRSKFIAMEYAKVYREIENNLRNKNLNK